MNLYKKEEFKCTSRGFLEGSNLTRAIFDLSFGTIVLVRIMGIMLGSLDVIDLICRGTK